MASSTVENYLKQIYLLKQHSEGRLVAMGVLAAEMNVAPGTATAMVKALSDSGLAQYEPRGGVRLSLAGEKLALHVLRRHRLVEQFLVQVLGLDWSEVHDEAEELEHAISDKLLERIDDYLGRPAVDPHGDPIPTAGGRLDKARRQSLADCQLDQPVRVCRVLDQRPDFLQFVDRNGLAPGADLIVRRRDEQGASVTLERAGEDPVTMGAAAAEKILVEEIPSRAA